MGEPSTPVEALEPRYERYTASYMSGVVLECFYPTGCTLHEAQVGHCLATVEADESSRVPVEAAP